MSVKYVQILKNRINKCNSIRIRYLLVSIILSFNYILKLFSLIFNNIKKYIKYCDWALQIIVSIKVSVKMYVI